jgi:hypothetical protein
MTEEGREASLKAIRIDFQLLFFARLRVQRETPLPANGLGFTKN